MHLPAWKPDLIILNSGAQAIINREQGTLRQERSRREVGVGGEEGGRYGLSHCVDVWCEKSICSSPVIVTQFPLSHTLARSHAHKLGAH